VSCDDDNACFLQTTTQSGMAFQRVNNSELDRSMTCLPIWSHWPEIWNSNSNSRWF